jgi:O-antigen/teichoic acid export membrane protein
LALFARLWIRLAFGSKFGPARASLVALSPLFNFTYLAMLLSMTLIVLGRGWTLTCVSCAAVLVQPLLSWCLVPRLGARLGPGGSGVGAALSVVGMEVFVTTLLLINVGRRAFDRDNLRQIGATLASCAVTVAVHVMTRPLGNGRLPLDAATYLLTAVATGSVQPRALRPLLAQLRGSEDRSARRGSA